MFGKKAALRIPTFQSPHAAAVAPAVPQNRKDERKARLKGPAGIWDEFNARPQEPAPIISNHLFTKSQQPNASTSALVQSTSTQPNPFLVQQPAPVEVPTNRRSTSFRPSVGPTHAEIAATDINAESELKAFLGRGNSAELVMTEWKHKRKQKSALPTAPVLHGRGGTKDYSPRRSRSRSVRPDPIPELVEASSSNHLPPAERQSSSTPPTANATNALTTISPAHSVKSVAGAGKKRKIGQVEQPLEPPSPAKAAAKKTKSKSASAAVEGIVEKPVVVEKKSTKAKRAISEVDAGAGEAVVTKKPRAIKAKKVVGVSNEQEEWEKLTGIKEISKKGKGKAVVEEEEATPPPKKKAAAKKRRVVEVEESAIVKEQVVVKKVLGKKYKAAVVTIATPSPVAKKRANKAGWDLSPAAKVNQNAVASTSKTTLDEVPSVKKDAKVDVVKKKAIKKVVPLNSSARQTVTRSISPKPKAKSKPKSKSTSTRPESPPVDAEAGVALGGYAFDEERLVSNTGKLNLMDLLGAGIAEMLRQELEVVGSGAAAKSLELYRDRVRAFFLTQSDQLSALTAVAAKVNSAKSKAKLLRAQIAAQDGAEALA